MSRMIFFAILISISFTKVHAFQCYVVSGLKVDWNGAFENISRDVKDDKLHLKSNSCKLFADWKKLDHFLNSVDKKEKILIIQAAHGNPGGGAMLDTSVVSGDDQLKYLNKFSKGRSVAFLDQSCYSGDLIARKLFNDKAESNNSSIDNLCIITASAFTYPALAAGMFDTSLLNRFNFDTEENLENIFLLSDSTQVGMISSAAWDTENFTDELSKIYLQFYLMNPNFALSGESLDGFLGRKALCSELDPNPFLPHPQMNLPKDFECSTIKYILKYYANFKNRELSNSEIENILKKNSCSKITEKLNDKSNHNLMKVSQIIAANPSDCININLLPTDLRVHNTVDKFTSWFFSPVGDGWGKDDHLSCENGKKAVEIIDRIVKFDDKNAKKEAANLSKDLLKSPADLWPILADSHTASKSNSLYLFANEFKNFSIESFSKKLTAPLDIRRRQACRSFK